jgi:hypothetical protein
LPQFTFHVTVKEEIVASSKGSLWRVRHDKKLPSLLFTKEGKNKDWIAESRPAMTT